MSNIYDSANQIEREIRELPEFKALKEAYEKVQANEEAHKLFKDFQAMQIELQEKQMSGQEFSDEDAMKAQEMAVKIQSEEVINDLMQKEQGFSTIINDLNRIIMTPVRRPLQRIKLFYETTEGVKETFGLER
ncbi:YlbF family regulator [Staphylococcus epidermidis]|uniref:YlbF family regulator n=2 Tax=Staphylococcus TaxID=1279 RepID=UPI0018E1ECFC